MNDGPNPSTLFVMGVAFTLIVITFPILLAVDTIAASQEQERAIEAGAAYYHPKTGEIVYGCEEGGDDDL